MKVVVDNDITIYKPTFEMVKWCREHLVLDNPDYIKKEAMGKWTGNVPREIYLYEQIYGSLRVPFGCLRDLWSFIGRKAEWENKIHDKIGCNVQSDVTLYDYQENAVISALLCKNGVLVMPCGSGKTQCGLEIISRLKGKALWLTHTEDLLNQSKRRAEAILQADKFGTITAGKVNVGDSITFATVQTMSRIDLQKYKDCWDIVIVDECQHCCGSPTKVTQFYKVVSNLSARYKYGLTATPKRADGLERAMFALLGNIVHEVTRAEVADTTCKVIVRQLPTGWMPEYDLVLTGDGTIDYNKVVDAMTHNEARFEFVRNEVDKCFGGTIVLANRVEYLQRLNDAYEGNSICLSTLGTSRKAREERKQALKRLNDGELDCIFATYQLAKEGLDVPNLRYIVFATPEKDETTVIQSVGRVGRKADNKVHGTVIDLVDDFPMFSGWAKKRRSYYKRIDATVEEN